MRLRLTVSDPGRAVPRVDLVVTAPSGSTLGDLRAALSGRGAWASGPLYLDGAEVEDRVPLGQPPLLDGAVLTTSRPREPTERAGFARGALLELHVTGGPDAGAVHPLAPGSHLLGRAPSADIVVTDPDVSRVHARLRVDAAGVTVCDEGSTNGTTVDGAPVVGTATSLPLGAVLRIGSSSLALRVPQDRRAGLRPSGSGTLVVNRSPRSVPEMERVEVRFPSEPEAPTPPPFPVVAMVLPLAVSVAMALLWSPFALLFGLMTPAMLLGNLLSDRRSGRRRYAEDLATYRTAEAACRGRLETAVAAERRTRDLSYPDAAALLATASSRDGRLWERRPQDRDHLELRVGSGDVTSLVTQVQASPSGPETSADLVLHGAPAVVALADAGVVGVAGLRPVAVALVRHLLAQVAVLHSPLDVRVAVLTLDAGRAAAWQWVQWLPHALPWDRVGPVLAGDEPSAARLAAALHRLLDRRKAAAVAGDAGRCTPAVVVVLDGAHELRGLPGVAQLLAEGPRHGIYVLPLGATTAHLPVECSMTVETTGEVGRTVRIRGGTSAPTTAVADLVSHAWAEAVARALAPLRDATPLHDDPVPARSRLLEVFERVTGRDPLDVQSVVEAWCRTPRSTSVLLGEHGAGVYAPDLRTHGPHALVAGTTGAGKSELLQSLIASLALGNRPDELVFLLVDYKGGAAFAHCAELPHTIGLVTDLDEHLTRRTLTSLSAEIRRREHLLREAGASDLEDYHRLAGARDTAPLPRLVIVVDEFRVLAEELPELVSGLVRLAAVGRSLGLHVVLATQRPSGVVSPEIRANANLRIALRVQDPADSRDVVDSSRAAGIDRALPGRAVARAGSEDLVEFQVARVGGREPADPPTGVSVSDLRWGEDVREDPVARGAPDGPTDLARLARTLREAAALVHAAPTRPWLPPLPELLSHGDALARLDGPAASPTALVIGLLDEPALMRQRPLVLDPQVDTGLAVVGGPRSGRSGVVAACVSAAARVPSAHLHVYVLGVAASTFGDIAAVPCVGAVIARGETERAVRLLRRLVTEVATRSDGRAEGRPAVLLLVDGWEALQRDLEDVDGGEPVEHLVRIVRDGPRVGVTSVVTGDRALLTGRLGAAFGSRLLLRSSDPADMLVAGVRANALPQQMPPGRGLLLAADATTEVQVCASSPLDGVPPVVGCRSLPHAVAPPFRVPPMPERVTEVDLRAAAAREADLPRVGVPVGVGGDEVRPLHLSLADCASLVVAGPAGSGRSSALALLARGLRRAGAQAVLVRARPSSGVELVPDGIPVVAGHETDRLAELLRPRSEGQGVFVLVDDADAMEGARAEDVLLAHLQRDEHGGVVLAGGATELGARYRGLAAEVRRARTGILLSPTGYADGDLLGAVVPRARGVRPGRGYLVRQGGVEVVQLAVPGPAASDPAAAPAPPPPAVAAAAGRAS